MDKAGLYGSTLGPAHETVVAEASGPATTLKPAFFWLGMVVVLVLARLVYEYAE